MDKQICTECGTFFKDGVMSDLQGGTQILRLFFGDKEIAPIVCEFCQMGADSPLPIKLTSQGLADYRSFYNGNRHLRLSS